MSHFINAVKHGCYFNVRSYLMPVSCEYLRVQFHRFHALNQTGISFTVFSCGHPSLPEICSSLGHQCLKISLQLPATPSLSTQSQRQRIILSYSKRKSMQRGRK